MTGAELKALREGAGLTQEQLAERLGYTGAQRAQTVSQYETGRRPIGPQLERLLRLLFEAV